MLSKVDDLVARYWSAMARVSELETIVCDDFEAQWKALVECPDDELSPGAQEIRRRMLEITGVADLRERLDLAVRVREPGLIRTRAAIDELGWMVSVARSTIRELSDACDGAEGAISRWQDGPPCDEGDDDAEQG